VSALEHGGQLLAQAPENKEFQTCMTFLLNAYQGHQLAEDVGDIASLKGNGPVRGYRPPAPLRVQLRSFFNVIWALVLREVLARHGRNRLGFFWAVLEPVVHIALLAVVFQLFLRIPPLGDNFFFFYFTGIVPYLLLSRVANEAGNAVMSNRNTMQIPLISPLELVIAKLLVELFTVSIMILVFGSAFVLLGWSGLPSEPGKVLGGLCMAALVGLGIGMIYASAQEFGRFAATLIFLILRLLYFTGGIFFVPEMIPQAYRELAAWNPLLHIVQLVREGAYPNYAPIDMDVGYPVLTIVLTLGVGIVFLKAVTPLMRVQK
jgi:capsular polysaccharide transport system permease protein